MPYKDKERIKTFAVKLHYIFANSFLPCQTQQLNIVNCLFRTQSIACSEHHHRRRHHQCLSLLVEHRPQTRFFHAVWLYHSRLVHQSLSQCLLFFSMCSLVFLVFLFFIFIFGSRKAIALWWCLGVSLVSVQSSSFFLA